MVCLLKFCCKHILQHCLDTSLQNVGEALPSFSPVCPGHIMKMLTTLEQLGIFLSYFDYLYILTCYAERQRGFNRQVSIRLMRMFVTIETYGTYLLSNFAYMDTHTLKRCLVTGIP